MKFANEVAHGERRGFHRRRVLKEARIVLNQRQSTIDCLVRDQTTTGARLKLPAPTALPEEFDVMFVSDNFAVECHLVWRKGDLIGVAFAGEQRPLSRPH